MADGRHFENRYIFRPISPYLSEKSSDFDDILYTAADFGLVERHMIKNEKVALARLRVRQNVFFVTIYTVSIRAYIGLPPTFPLPCETRKSKNVTELDSVLNKLLTCSWGHFEDLIYYLKVVRQTVSRLLALTD